MKTAIYIEDSVVQLVITPETEWEKKALNSFGDQPIEAKMFTGAFYDCRGGWVRQKQHYVPSVFSCDDDQDRSLILKTSITPKEQ